jgi:epoxyqueuosine reductase
MPRAGGASLQGMARSEPGHDGNELKMDSQTIKERIREKALELGFAAAGFCSAEGVAGDGANLAAYLGQGRHGDMDWLERNRERRGSPQALWPEARSIVVLGFNYGPHADPRLQTARAERGAVSVYAQGRDYHDVMKARLKTLGRWMADTFAAEVKVFVDTAPVMEKPLAARAGIGWQGKHTNLVSRAFGSWLFLGEVFTTLALPPDPPEADHCGACDLCRAACPTGALDDGPYRIDPTRCVSYLTIEHKGDIAPDLAERLGNRIYGCDDCLSVCPWTKFTERTTEPALLPRVELTAPLLSDLIELDDTSFRQVFAGSPIKRTGRDRFLRNVLIAIGNGGDRRLAARLRELAEGDASPLVRRAAQWALDRLEKHS